MVDRSDRLALLPPTVNPRLQCANVQVIYGFTPDPRHQQLEVQDVVVETSFVLVLQDKLRRSLFERAKGPDAIDLRLPCCFHHSCEIAFRFFDLTSINRAQILRRSNDCFWHTVIIRAATAAASGIWWFI